MVKSIQFPDMISTGGLSQYVVDKKATEQNLKYLLLSTKKTLLGDPYFGVNLRNLIFEKNNVILRDLVIDDIFTAMTIYMPQLRVERKNISVVSDGKVVQVTITAQNIIDYSFDNYILKLLDIEEV